MTVSGPILLAPHFVEKPWGGQVLANYGFDLPADAPIGEAWLTASESTIASGAHAGRRLGEIVADDPTGTVGERGLRATHGLPLFPLLIKVLSANENLSIQVHPSDEDASPGQLGKTEAWHVLDAEPGALLYLGLDEGASVADLEQIARRGESTAPLMRQVPATPGMTIFQPPGTVHALGAGVVIYEIQQPSGITYRLDDWGRVDRDGRPRELHLDESFAVLDPSSRPEPVPPQPLPSTAGTRTLLVSCPLFTAERIELGAAESLVLNGEGAPQVFTLLSGGIAVTADGVTIEAAAGQSVALLAGAGVAQVSAIAPSTIIRGWLAPFA